MCHHGCFKVVAFLLLPTFKPTVPECPGRFLGHTLFIGWPSHDREYGDMLPSLGDSRGGWLGGGGGLGLVLGGQQLGYPWDTELSTVALNIGSHYIRR